MAAAIGASNLRTASAVQFFESRGLIRTDRRSPARTWVALAEGPLREQLVAFGRRIAALDDIRPILPRPRAAPPSREVRTQADDLFVTRSATKILVHVALAGETDAAELHRRLGIDESVVRATVGRLVRDGILRRRRRDWKRIPIVLDERHPAAPEIRDLILAVAKIRPQARAIVGASRRGHAPPVPVRKPKATFARTGLGRAVDLLPIFGPGQARVLAALASRGPLNGLALAKRVGVNPTAARIVARTLAAAGMVRATPTRSGTVVEYALDPCYALAPELWALVTAACRASRLRVEVGASAGPRRSGKPGWPADHRGRAALALALAGARAADLAEIAKATRAKRRQVAARLALLRDAGWIELEMVGARTVAHSGHPPVGPEAKTLLDAMRAAGLKPLDIRVMGDVS